MKTYNAVCPVCGKLNRNLYLEDSEGWMECERCLTAVRIKAYTDKGIHTEADAGDYKKYIRTDAGGGKTHAGTGVESRKMHTGAEAGNRKMHAGAEADSRKKQAEAA